VRKGQPAIVDLDFALRQPAAEVPRLLDMRVHVLLKEPKLPAALESALKMKERAGDKPDHFTVRRVCMRCVRRRRRNEESGRRHSRLRGVCRRSDGALEASRRRGYKNTAHMNKDTDLDPLRGREEFKKLLAELEGKTKDEKKPPG